MIKKEKNILVIGGAGYIGSHITLELCERGYNVIVFDNLSTGNQTNVDKRAKFIKGDILNKQDLEDAFCNSLDAVFHFAALKAASDSMINPEKYSITNISGTINILNKMTEKGIPNIIFSSSAAVYGLPKYLPLDEKHPLNPINYYGFTKKEIENIIEWYSKIKNINFASLRYFNAVGYDNDSRIKEVEKKTKNLFPNIMEVAIGKRKYINLFGNDYNTHDGTCIRDYIHVKDLSIAHIYAFEYLMSNKKNITLNLGTGIGYSVAEIIKFAEKYTNKKISYRVQNRRLGDIERLIACSKFAKEKINWFAQFSDIENIFQSMWNVYKNL
tara:strand:- start:862 stop:1845 length:984 start_codon:yes stop_codon:yes gene_type:complete